MNEAFRLEAMYEAASVRNNDVEWKKFTAHQIPLSKALTAATRVENRMNDTCKPNSFNIQKLQLKEQITASEIARKHLNAYQFSVCYITLFHRFVVHYN